MKICGTCKKPVAYIVTRTSGLWRHGTGNWRCAPPFIGDANTSQIEVRMAKCSVCKTEKPTSELEGDKLLVHHTYLDHDDYWCGCVGGD